MLVALRGDYYGRFAAYPTLADRLGSNHVLIGPMRGAELRRAIELPAARVGLTLEPGLAQALVDDVEGEPGALPLLSTTLFELWQGRADDAITLASYRDSGGMRTAVARLAEGTYGRVPDEHQPLVRTIMLRLVAGGDGDTAVRRRARWPSSTLDHDQDVASVLATLADNRLVSVSDTGVEVAHEALLREWPRLRDWIEEDAQGRRLRRQLVLASMEWEQAGRDAAELYRGPRLAATLDWAAAREPELNDLERDFIDASRDASQRETRRVRRINRRLRVLLASVAVLLAAAVAGGVYALAQRGDARDAASRAEASDEAELLQRLGAQALAEEDLDRSLLLARQAVAIADTPQTRGYLLAALRRSPAVLGIMHGTEGSNLRAVAVSPDGNTLAMGGLGLGLALFDAANFEQIGQPFPVAVETYSGLPFVGAVAYSPDGTTLAFADSDGIRTIDTRTYEVLARAADGGDSLAFTPDGKLLVHLDLGTVGGPATVVARDATTLEQVGPGIAPPGFSSSYISKWQSPPPFALAPDGREVVTVSEEGELAWWDLRTGEKRRDVRLSSGRHHSVALSPDGRQAALGTDTGIELVDTRTGGIRAAAGTLTNAAHWVVFSPDGDTIVSTSLDSSVTLWDPESAAPTQTLRGHSDGVNQPAFSPDGRTLYTVQRRRIGDRVGSDGDPGPREAVRVHARPRLRRRVRPASGQVQPGRDADRRRPEGARRPAPGRGAPDSTRPAASRYPWGGEGPGIHSGRHDARRCESHWLRDALGRPHASPRPGTVPRVHHWLRVRASISADGTMLATAGAGGVRLRDIATGEDLGTVGDSLSPAAWPSARPGPPWCSWVRTRERWSSGTCPERRPRASHATARTASTATSPSPSARTARPSRRAGRRDRTGPGSPAPAGSSTSSTTAAPASWRSTSARTVPRSPSRASSRWPRSGTSPAGRESAPA